MNTRRALILCTVLLSCFWQTHPPLAGDEDVERSVSRLRYVWDDEELPVERLILDANSAHPRSVGAAQAVEDVERLFYLFAHGYAGYALFGDEQQWQQARRRIVDRLDTRSRWPVAELPTLFRSELDFVRDCHTSIGDLSFCDHWDLWYDDTLELSGGDGRFRFDRDGRGYTLSAIDGRDPEEFLFLSLNRLGEPIHRIGTLADAPPDPVVVEAVGEAGRISIEVPLHRSDFNHYAEEVFRQDRIGGIPVVRVRSFSDDYSDSLERWLDTAENLRDEPCVIVDLRGNGGGNERWTVEWIRRLTGHRSALPLISSELNSRTSIAGRVNAFEHWRKLTPESDYLHGQAERYAELLDRSGIGGERPIWSGPIFPDDSTIPNPTTIILITSGRVASAAEGMVLRASRAENVVVVGENTRGALTFGNVGLYRLPHSGLDVWLPINFVLFPDLVLREETGLEPDYWVPAADAVNFAVAAVRKGTIATARASPAEWMQREFTPEDPMQRLKAAMRRRAMVVALLALAAVGGTFLMRRSPRVITGMGVVWMFIGAVWMIVGGSKGSHSVTVGVGLVAFGAAMLLGRAFLRLRESRLPPRPNDVTDGGGSCDNENE